MIWFFLIIPVLLTGMLYTFSSLRKQTVWWEPAIAIVITVITIFICQLIAVNSATKDNEYWGHMTYKAVHEEPFSYDSECPETYQCGTSCDSKGNCSPVYCVRWVHCVESKSTNCYLIDDRDQTYHISKPYYDKLAKKWENFNYGNEKIVTRSHGYTTVGDKHKRPNHGNRHWVFWPQDKWDVSEPIVVEHTYENRLQTLSHWGKLSEIEIKENDLFWYPVVGGGWLSTTILSNGPKFPKSDMYFRYLNGYLNTNKGGYKKTRIWVLIWNKQPQVVANYQRRYWKGGNKNEFIIMLGTNESQEITWADIMTWSESDTFTVNVRDKILLEMAEGKNGFSGKLTDEDLLKFAQWFGTIAKAEYVKPSFDEQNKMIDVQPSEFALLISFFIIMLVNCGVGFFIIKNSWHDNDDRW